MPQPKELLEPLRELKNLLEEGLLTQEEFAEQKAKLLDAGIPSTFVERQPNVLSAPQSVSEGANADEKRDIEKKEASLGGMGCLEIEPLIVNAILAFFFPFLWIPVIAFIFASIALSAKRSETRAALKSAPIEVARSSLASARTWHGVASVASILLWATEIIGLFLLVKGASSFVQFFSGA